MRRHANRSAGVAVAGVPADAPHGAPQHTYQQAGGRFNQFSQNVTAMVRNGVALEAAEKLLFDVLNGEVDLSALIKKRKVVKPHYRALAGETFDAGTQPEFEVLRARVSRDNQTPLVIRQRANREAAEEDVVAAARRAAPLGAGARPRRSACRGPR